VLTLGVRGVAAWAPGVETEEEWRSWGRAPCALPWDGTAEGRFLPPMLRRRCTPLSKAMLHVAFAACPEVERAHVRTVFASRHGENHESFPLFELVVTGQPLSPTRFTHTVHNAQAALYSIATGNRCAASAVAGERDTFGAGLLEALCHLEREPERPTLLVVGEVPVAEFAVDRIGEPLSSFAIALLLARGSAGVPIGYELLADDPPRDDGDGLAWPPALEFVRWWHAGSSQLELRGPRARHRFTRLGKRSAQ
jgi:hypothetical protein